MWIFTYAEKLRFFEEKINDYQLELRNRARLIYELRERLEAEKLNNKFQPKLEEISISTELKVIAVNLSFYWSHLVGCVSLTMLP